MSRAAIISWSVSLSILWWGRPAMLSVGHRAMLKSPASHRLSVCVARLSCCRLSKNSIFSVKEFGA